MTWFNALYGANPIVIDPKQAAALKAAFTAPKPGQIVRMKPRAMGASRAAFVAGLVGTGALTATEAVQLLQQLKADQNPPPIPRETRYGSLHGWRRWLLCDHDHALLLSPVRNMTWEGPEKRALCCCTGYKPFHPDTCAGKCGIYAHRTPQSPVWESMQAPLVKTSVVGRVELWGEGVEAVEGWRMEYARIELLICAPYTADCEIRGLAARYGCPVKVIPGDEWSGSVVDSEELAIKLEAEWWTTWPGASGDPLDQELQSLVRQERAE